MSATQPTLSDGRVTLRPLREDDVQGVWEQCNDPLSIRWTQVPVPYSHADARDFCLEIAAGAWAEGSQAIFAVESDGAYCGNIALRDEGRGRAEIAYGAHPAARGRGVMTAAVRLLLDWGFAARGVQTMIWRAEIGNWASRRLAWRLGFSHDGVLRHSLESRDAGLVDGWLGTLRPTDPRGPRGRWLDAPVLEGDGVRLRALGEEDLPRVVETARDERTQRWLAGKPAAYSGDDARAWLSSVHEQQATGRGTTWAVTGADADLMLAAVFVFDVGEADCEVGYWAHPDARGRGVTGAAVRAVTSWAFSELGVRRVLGTAAQANTASRHVLEAAGFHQIGLERLGTRTRVGGEPTRTDAVRYDVLAEEWTGSASAASTPPPSR